ncbi:MAG: outer membrane beta-barrel protein, partial [Dokdonella sp.]
AMGALVAILTVVNSAQAQQQALQEPVTDHLNLDFYGTASYTDNVFLTETGQDGQVVLRPRVDIDYLRPGRVVESQVNGRFEGRQYLGGAFGADLIGNLAARANWHAMPGRLDWVFEDFIATAGISPISNSTPDGVQLANVAVTGPTLRARFNPRFNGQLDLRYARSDAQTTNDFDGNRLAAAGRLMYILTPTSKAVLNLAVQEARYDTAPVSTDFDRRDATVTYERRGPNNAVSIEAGYTWLDFLGNGGQFAGNLLRANASYQFTPRASIAVEIGRQYTDAANSMQMSTGQVGLVANNTGLSRISITPDIYREKRAGVSFRYRGDTWSARLEPFAREVRYLHPNEFAIDMDSRGFDVYADYRFTPLWMLSTYLHIENGKYPGLNASDDNRLLSTYLLYQFARRWAWRFEYTYQQRDSDLPGFTYRENVIGASLIYRRYEDILK